MNGDQLNLDAYVQMMREMGYEPPDVTSGDILREMEAARAERARRYMPTQVRTPEPNAPDAT